MRWSKVVKKRAADLFDQGLGYKAVASKLGVSRDAVREWACVYRALGRDGLVNRTRRTYSPEVKLAAARDRASGMAVVDVMAKYGVANRRQVKDWTARYIEEGPSAFEAKED